MQGSPITLPIYNENDELVKTLSKGRIKDEFLERAIELADQMKDNNNPKESIAMVNQLLADFFGVPFEEILNGSDFGEKIAALQAIISRASQVISDSGLSNPT